MGEEHHMDSDDERDHWDSEDDMEEHHMDSDDERDHWDSEDDMGKDHHDWDSEDEHHKDDKDGEKDDLDMLMDALEDLFSMDGASTMAAYSVGAVATIAAISF